MKHRFVDARGQHGAQGEDGSGYSGQSGTGGLTGTPGGIIEADLTFGAGRLQLAGTCRGEPFCLLSEPAQSETISLTARGGDGGHGGSGARGKTGSTGSRGRDATRYSSGGDGGPGGNGGRGGAAGSGGASGAGGTVRLKVPLSDSDLLLALTWDVSAGTPGNPGAVGPGGMGGAGGAGGSSYSWTETESYTDSEGNSRTRTVSKSNPGGSDGHSGSPGPPGSPGKRGDRAVDGLFQLYLEGVGAFRDRYRLLCDRFEVLSGDGNNIFEFGEKNNRVSKTQVRNAGPAPSPPEHVRGQLTGEPFFHPLDDLHHVPSLKSGQSFILPDFRFDLEEAAETDLPTEHGVLRKQVELTPRLFFSRLLRFDPEFQRPQNLCLTFPVELVTVPSTTSLGLGRVIKQEWRVVNHSDQPFPTAGRDLFFDLSLEHEGAQLRVTDEEGVVFELSEQPRQFRQLQPISPGESQSLAVYIHVEEGSEPYSKATLCAGIRLTPQGGGPARLIQRNPTQYSVALTHSDSPADLLLLAHHGCQALEMKNWLELCAKLNLSCNIWDVSFYGSFPLPRLAEQYQGKLVVILNSPFQAPNRESRMPTDFVDLADYRWAVSAKGLSFYVLGEQTDLLQFLVPQPAEVVTYDSVTEYLKKGHVSADRVNPEVPAEMNRRLHKIGVSRFFVNGEPRPEYLQRKAMTLLQKLKKKLPQQRFLLTTIFKPDENEGWLRNRSCGALVVREMPDTDARAVVTRQVYRQTAQSRQFLFSAENLLGLFSAQDFDDKLETLRRLGPGSGDPFEETICEALADAILMDLCEEQIDLRRTRVRLSSRAMGRALNRTMEFCQSDFREGRETLDCESRLGSVLVRIAAGLGFLSSHQMAWWDHRVRFLGGSNDVEVTLFLQKAIDTLLDRNFGPDRLWGTKAPRKKVEALVAARTQDLEKNRERLAQVAGKKLKKKATAVEALVRWELRDNLQSDGEGESSLWSQDVMQKHQARENKHQRRLATVLADFRSALAQAEAEAVP